MSRLHHSEGLNSYACPITPSCRAAVIKCKDRLNDTRCLLQAFPLRLGTMVSANWFSRYDSVKPDKIRRGCCGKRLLMSRLWGCQPCWGPLVAKTLSLRDHRSQTSLVRDEVRQHDAELVSDRGWIRCSEKSSPVFREMLTDSIGCYSLLLLSRILHDSYSQRQQYICKRDRQVWEEPWCI